MLTGTAMEIRDVRGVEELRACQALQRRAWGIVEDGYVLPIATMVGVQKYSGLVLGAFQDGQLVGFAFAFLGRVRGEAVLYSQLTAVDPALQRSGVGRQLKQAQRVRAREMGLASVAWVFDPLQAGNAYFNLGVLGAISRQYEVDLYGARSDTLNVGLATDRILAEWSTLGDPVGEKERGSKGDNLLSSEPAGVDSLPRPVEVSTARTSGAQRLFVEIPRDLAAVRGTMDLALAWQNAVRSALGGAFEAGYTAVGFARGERPCYILERRT
jgi:predicted GNAT superfamily acetyltransferase